LKNTLTIRVFTDKILEQNKAGRQCRSHPADIRVAVNTVIIPAFAGLSVCGRVLAASVFLFVKIMLLFYGGALVSALRPIKSMRRFRIKKSGLSVKTGISSV